jgi:hypothetical protein
MRATSVDCRSDNREIETVRGSDIAIQHFTEMQGQIDHANPLA